MHVAFIHVKQCSVDEPTAGTQKDETAQDKTYLKFHILNKSHFWILCTKSPVFPLSLFCCQLPFIHYLFVRLLIFLS